MNNNAPAILESPGELSAVMRPVGSVAELRKAFTDYQELTKSLLTEDDYQTIQGRKFPKKSAWRKLSTAFGVSFKIADRNIEMDEDGRVQRADFTVTAIAPNGRSMDGWGSCDLHEKCCPRNCRRSHNHCPAARGERCDGAIHFSHPNHDIPATAETRAKNRAASDLFGMGEVSAEEVMDAGEPEPRQQRTAPRQQQRQQAAPAPSAPVNGNRGSLVARIKKAAPDHPQVKDNTISAMSPKQLEALAKSVGVDLDGGQATETSVPSGKDWTDHWSAVADKAGIWPAEIEQALQSTPEGKDLTLASLDPESEPGKKLTAIFNRTAGAA